MDRISGLIRAGICCVFALLSAGAFAQATTCPGYQSALAACRNAGNNLAQYGITYTCDAEPFAGHGPGAYMMVLNYTRSDGSTGRAEQDAFVCDTPPASNPCGEGKQFNTNYAGKIEAGMKQCHPVPQPDGSSVQCGFTATPISPPVQNQYGNWQTYIKYSEGGDVCSGDGTHGNSWTNSDGSAPKDPPPAKPVPDVDDDKPGKLCGNESCYDPKTGQYCAQGDSGQICTPGAPPGQTGGSCASGGDATVCAGSPQAPKPPPAKVPDPPTQTQGTDNYTHADPNTGDKYNTTVTTYTTGPNPTSNGAAQGDTQPAHSSSSGGSSGGDDDKGGDKTTAGGGGDCNNPPHVEGSAALDLIARQAWLLRCDGGDADDSNKTLPGVADGVPDSAGDATGVKDGGSMFAALDFSGLVGGGATCPQPISLDIPEWGVSYHTAPESWCTLLSALGLVIMFLATYRACTVLGST